MGLSEQNLDLACRHHPADEFLLGYAAGSAHEASALVVATHLTYCPHCRARIAQTEAIGGALLEDLAPVATQVTADAILRRADSAKPAVVQKRASTGDLPRALSAYIPDGPQALKWRWFGPGISYASLMGDDTGATLGLMKVAGSASLPHHGHTEDELTMVLTGGFTDGGVAYGPGDVQCADANLIHEPIADPEGCLALVMIRGTMKPSGFIAKIFQHFIKF